MIIFESHVTKWYFHQYSSLLKLEIGFVCLKTQIFIQLTPKKSLNRLPLSAVDATEQEKKNSFSGVVAKTMELLVISCSG